MKAAFYTLGCKVNQYETEAMTELLEAAGYQTVDFSQAADVYVINTCTVTAVADRKSRQMMRRAAARKLPGGIVCVGGCLAQRDAEALLAMPEVDAVFGSSGKGRIVQIVAEARRGVRELNMVSDIEQTTVFEPLQISKSGERTRANIKICDGCDNYCTYCIIPYARGPVRSREPGAIIEEAKRLADNGVCEVVLTGIHVSSYGKDLKDATLQDVLVDLQKIEGIKRIRLSSLEPSLLSEEFCKTVSALDKVCPHFHVSMQSGSDTVLKRMGRRYTVAEYARYLQNVRDYFDTPAFTTDIIAGFQGETEGEHAQTKAFVQEMGFARVHVFPYSKRTGTAAAKLPGDVPSDVKKRRAAELIILGDQSAEHFAQEFVGRVEPVLFEQYTKDGLAEGYTPHYLSVQAKDGVPGQIQKVKITQVKNSMCLAELT